MLLAASLCAQESAQEKPQELKKRGETTKPQEVDKDGLPPEEDKSLAVPVYGFNPLQAQKEISVGNQYFKKGSFRAAAGRFEEATKWNSGEPEAWLRAKAGAASSGGVRSSIGSPVELFRHPRWRKNTVIGLLLGVSGMIGLWGIGFFSPELISTALRGETQAVVDRVRGLGTALQDVGSFFGMVTFTMIAAFLSRRIAFLGALLLSMTVTAFVFTSLHSASDAYWMLPMMGFAQLAVFAGYSIYFPELFPTRLRGTGVGFCYNTVRYLAAPAPILFGYLATVMSFRTAAVLMSSVYLIGTVALIWAPETKGKPLPED